jgi:hypothetical protein
VQALWSACAGIAAGAAVAIASVSMVGARAAAALAALAAAVVAGRSLALAWRRWTPLALVSLTEARVGGFDNLLVTAIELEANPERAPRAIRTEVWRQASARAAAVPVEVVVPQTRAALACLGVALGGALVSWTVLVNRPTGSGLDVVMPVATDAIRNVRVTIVPPDYRRRPAIVLDDPAFIEMLQGSRVRLDVASDRPLVWLDHPDGRSQPLPADGGASAFALEWVPERTSTLVLSAGTSSDAPERSRVLTLTVVPDAAPSVRILTPARDLAFTTAPRTVNIEVEAGDDEGISALELIYTRMSGSGEAFDFQEGRVPLTIERASATSWRARGQWSVAALGLDEGDSLVYRARVRDTNPAGEPVVSESFTIEVGRRLEFASAGAAIPDEERRYAISQQMVILKTERLNAARATHDAATWADETRLLALEQRMVRSEVVFLSGGEVQDEVEEAAHSHEVQEGRLENTGRSEMLRAIAEMSRAEARLSAGDTAGALVFERVALAALQRAFDRRRFFLRTLPERSRIDVSRRLSGDRTGAGSSERNVAPVDPDPVRRERELIHALAPMASEGFAVAATVAARLASLGNGADDWHRLATALVTAEGERDRRAAAEAAMLALSARARATLPPSAEPRASTVTPISGWWAIERRTIGGRR